MRMWRMVLMTMALISAPSFSCCGIEDRTDLEVTAPKKTLRVGETVQLSVLQRLPDGSTRELTKPSTGSVYFTTSESMLIPEPDGRVTCIGTDGQDEESAVIGVVNGRHHGHIRFKLLAPGLALKSLPTKRCFTKERTRSFMFSSCSPSAAARK